MNYMIAKIKASKNACLLGTIDNVDKDYQIIFGVSRLADLPADASFRMNDDFPKSIALTDALHNRSRLVVASVRLRACLESIPGALFQNEMLPVTIVNHKGRREKAAYVIISQLAPPSCLKEQDCVGTKSRLKPQCFQFIKKMVLDEGKIDPRLMLFRAAEYPEVPLIRRDLAVKLEAEHFVGITFHEIEGYEF